MRLPDFMIIGAPKAATTTLRGKLGNHPGIIMSDPKEPMFFSNPEVNARGMDWYASLFESARPDQICGEASTTYMRFPYTESPNTLNPWPAISKLEKTPRFIYAMRNPVDRAYSHYVHHKRYGQTSTFEEAIKENPVYLNCSRYEAQMNEFRKHLPDATIYPVTFEDLTRNREATTARILEFLGVSAHIPPDPHVSKMNREHETQLLSAKLNLLPGSKLAKKVLPLKARHAIKNRILNSVFGRGIKEQIKAEPMLPETRQRLIDMFEPDVQMAEQLLNQPLPHWRE